MSATQIGRSKGFPAATLMTLSFQLEGKTLEGPRADTLDGLPDPDHWAATMSSSDDDEEFLECFGYFQDRIVGKSADAAAAGVSLGLGSLGESHAMPPDLLAARPD